MHHGRVFSSVPPVDFVPSPNSISPASTSPSTPDVPGTPVRSAAALHPTEPANQIQPYLCFGFVIKNAVVYLSDVSHIPEDVWRMLLSISPHGDLFHAAPPVLVLDCLRVQPHTSHLSIAQSVEVARRMKAQRTYWLGFGHELSHEEYVAIGEVVGGKDPSEMELTSRELAALQTLEEGPRVWVRPAFDGLRVFVSDDDAARDEEYS